MLFIWEEKNEQRSIYIKTVASGASWAYLRGTYAAVAAMTEAMTNTVTNIVTNAVEKIEWKILWVTCNSGYLITVGINTISHVTFVQQERSNTSNNGKAIWTDVTEHCWYYGGAEWAIPNGIAKVGCSCSTPVHWYSRLASYFVYKYDIRNGDEFFIEYLQHIYSVFTTYLQYFRSVFTAFYRLQSLLSYAR
jgi:hypothetical protein